MKKKDFIKWLDKGAKTFPHMNREKGDVEIINYFYLEDKISWAFAGSTEKQWSSVGSLASEVTRPRPY